MKTQINRIAFIAGFMALFTVFSVAARAQNYSIDWYKIAGGGGASAGGSYSLTGTIGQPDASGAMTGGNYSVTGGFWALIQVIQTPGAPMLNISHSGKVVTVYWQNVSGWNLIQNGNLTTPLASWPASTGISLVNGTNYLSLTNVTGSAFFRLANP